MTSISWTQAQIRQIVEDSVQFSKFETKRVSLLDKNVLSVPSDESRLNAISIRNNTLRIMEIVKALRTWNEINPHSDVERTKVFEIGLGYAEVALSIAQLGLGNVTGIEHPMRSFLFTPEYRQTLNQSNIAVVATNLLDKRLPFQDNAYDISLFCEVIEHLPPTMVSSTLAEIARVTKPGGGIIIATPNLTCFSNRIAFLMGKSIDSPAIPMERAGGTYGHIRLYTPSDVAFLCKPFGLSMNSVWYSDAMLLGGQERFAVKILKYIGLAVSNIWQPLAHNWTALFIKDH